MKATLNEKERAKKSFKAFSVMTPSAKTNVLSRYIKTMEKKDLSKLSSLLEILILKDKVLKP